MDTFTLTLDPDARRLLVQALDAYAYENADEQYRNNGAVIAPYSDTEDDAKAVAAALAMQQQLESHEPRKAAVIVDVDDDEEYPKAPACPYCGSTNLRHTEDTTLNRHVYGITPDGVLCIHGHYDADDEGSTDDRFWCADCWKDSDFPPGVDIDYL